jgi:hypothetical protein
MILIPNLFLACLRFQVGCAGGQVFAGERLFHFVSGTDHQAHRAMTGYGSLSLQYDALPVLVVPRRGLACKKPELASQQPRLHIPAKAAIHSLALLRLKPRLQL